MTVAAGAVPAVELRGITKAFPGVVANEDIDLALWPGEIHCLLGENGAGKSTLMHILSGVYRADAGSIAVSGQSVEIDSPRRAIESGIGMVYQHPTLVSTFTVIENLLLGGGAFRLDRPAALRRYRVLAGPLGSTVPPDAVVGGLELGRQQQVEIMKALWAGPKILVLDEPTSMLAPQEVDDLGRVLSALREQGLAIVLITHKLREALALGDRVTVLREGRVAGRLAPEGMRALSAGELRARIVEMMFGQGSAAVEGALATELDEVEPAGRRRPPGAEVVLEVRGVSLRAGPQEAGLGDIRLNVRRGEVLGIAGVDGNGQRELAEVLAGQRPVGEGRVVLAGLDITRFGVARRQALGLHYVTDDRLGEGIVPALPISLNLLLKRIGQRPFWRAGRVSSSAVRENAAGLISAFDIRAPGPDTPGGTLSGGNIQKIILARELALGATVVVYNKPTTGLDLRTTAAIRQRIRALAEEGVAAVLISADLDELLGLSDRIAVMYRGRLSGVVDNQGLDVRRQVGALMLGAGPAAATRAAGGEEGAGHRGDPGAGAAPGGEHGAGRGGGS